MTPRGREEATLVAVVVYDDVEPIDIGGTVGVLSMACRVLPGLRAVTVAERAGPVRCAGGLVVEAAHGFSDVPQSDAVLVAGGPGWRREASNPAMLDWLRARDAARLGSVCTGALILGAAGLLAGRAATTRRAALGSETESPLSLLAGTGALPRAAQVVDEGGGAPWTSGGVSLAIDGTLHLIGRLYGEAVRDEVAALIEYDRAWAANRAALGR